jgi:hypothetical protein
VYEATIEVEQEKLFRLIVDETDAQRLRLCAATRGIAVRDHDEDPSRTAEPASED